MKTAKRQFLVRVAGVDGYFATRTGGRKTAAITKAFDGGARDPDLLSAPALVDDVTITRPYDTDRDGPLELRLLPLVGAWETTLHVTPTDGNLVPLGPTKTFQGRLSAVAGPESDAGSGDSGTLELVFSIRSVA